MEENKELDNFVRSAVREIGLEKPSVNFTDSVLSKINTVSQKNTISVTKPLIPKSVWFCILCVMAVVFGYVIFNSSNAESTWLAAVKLNQLTSFNLSLNMPEFSLPTAFVYGSVAIALFACLQVLLLKQKLDKNYIVR